MTDYLNHPPDFSYAACRGHDPNEFFPDGGPRNRTKSRLVLRAKSICGGCPVRETCLDYALTLGIDVGIFGGYTPEERDRLRLRHHRRGGA